MSKSSMGSLVSVGLLGGAAYVAGSYFGWWSLPSWLSSFLPASTTPAASPNPAGGSTTPASSGPPVTTTPAPTTVLTTVPQTINIPTPYGTQTFNIPAQSYPGGWSSVQFPAAYSDATSQMLGQLILAVAAAGGTPANLTYDQWNYYYNKLKGSYLRAAAGLDTTSTPISAAQFLVGSGLSGLGPYVPLQGGYQRRRSILQRAPVVQDMRGQQTKNFRMVAWPAKVVN